MSRAEVEKPRDSLAALRISRTDPPRPSRSWRRWLRRLVVLVVLISISGGGLFLASQSGWLNVAEKLQPRLEVRVASVSVETGRAGDAVVVATGYLESRQQAKIGARGVGRIETLNVEEGARVEKGQVLAILEHADLKAALAAANATLARSKAEVAEQKVEIARRGRDLDRAARLRGTPAMAESSFDDVQYQHDAATARLVSLEAAVALAEARVGEAEQMIENMHVRAPFNGTVISKDAELGESIMPGGMGEASGRGSVVTIADLEHLEVDCDVKEDYISRVTIGQPAEVAVDAVPDRRYKGRVRKVIPMGDRARATIKVKVEILDADERLFPEMSSTVFFLPEASETSREIAEQRIFCPSDALVAESESGPAYVWLVDDESRLRRVEVKAGAEASGRTEILAGLSGGEQAVVRPPAEVREGQLVKVVE
jgi:RND family efflux transporter MFP subunit